MVVVEQQPQQNESQLQPDVLLLEPPNPQVVFAGDRLVLKCQLSSQTASDATLEWLLNNVPIVSQLPNLNISEQRAQFSVTSHLTVIKLEVIIH